MIDVALHQRLGDLTLDVAFEAPAGLTAIFGPSGAGKTSILRAIAGLTSLQSGHVRLDGQELSHLPPQARKIGYVFQDARLFPHMTVEQNLAYGGSHDRDRIIEMLGLGDLLNRRPANLSGGEAQRVAIGRALMRAPQLLLLDEPLASLDAARKAEVMPYLERLRDTAEVPILYVSHDMAEVARLATTLVLVRDGRLVQAGPLETLLSAPALIPELGASVAGAVLPVQVTDFDPADHMTKVQAKAGRLMIPGQIGTVGETLRLRIPARDVILSDVAPTRLSALNSLAVTIQSLTDTHDGYVDVALDAAGDPLLARITRRSARQMDLKPGQVIFAIIKATAVNR